MRIHFEIREKLPEIIEEILNCERWTTLVKEDISGRKLVVIRDPNYNSEATVEIYAREITIKTAWSNYTYRLFVLGDKVGAVYWWDAVKTSHCKFNKRVVDVFPISLSNQHCFYVLIEIL